ncbi:MAG: hypothetical protein RI565_01245 [Schleiferiaceae bacterium]|nr:hypothetical protein [Schleiferiaceae bacterium]
MVGIFRVVRPLNDGKAVVGVPNWLGTGNAGAPLVPTAGAKLFHSSVLSGNIDHEA